ncbi:MAG: hypothetical protein JSS65_00345 [Armatimonadetes bacterium]|nr:hypothetical protein [Armatimonadota bacterium]
MRSLRIVIGRLAVAVAVFLGAVLVPALVLWPQQKTSSTKPTAPAKESPEDKFRLRVSKWATDAQLVRKKKEVKTVAKGDKLEIADLLGTKKKSVEVAVGALGLEVIQHDTKVRYTSVRPPQLNPVNDLEFVKEIEGGDVLQRVSLLTQKSRYTVKAFGKTATSKGTAYSVRQTAGNEVEVLVAEGEVGVQLGDDGPSLTVGPRQKAVVNQTLPNGPVAVTQADELRIRQLLSIPIKTLRGYSDPIELRRSDAETIVTLNVRPALKVYEVKDVPGHESRPSSILLAADGFTYVDADGETHEFKGWTYLAAARNGRAFAAYKPGTGAATFDEKGKQVAVVTKEKPANFRITPDGARVFWMAIEPLLDDNGKPVPSKTQNVIHMADAKSGLGKPVNNFMGVTSFELVSRRGGQVSFLTASVGDTYVVYGTVGMQYAQTPATLQAEYPYSGKVPALISPAGEWVTASGGGPEYTLVRVADGKQFKVTSKAPLRFYSRKVGNTGGEQVVFIDANGVTKIADPANLALAVLFVSQEGMPLDLYNQSSTSPNGELVTYRQEKTGTAHVADSLDFARHSDTYVGIRRPYACEWVSGNEVWYKDGEKSDEEEIIITLGVKRPGAVPRGSGDNDDEQPADAIRELTFYGKPFIHEFNVGGVSSNGAVGGIAKGDGMDGFFAAAGSGVAVDIPDGRLVFDIGEDGTMSGNHMYGDGIFAARVRPGGVLDLAACQGIASAGANLRVLDDGSVFSSGKLWRPWATPDKKGNDGLFVGTVADKPVPGVEVLAMSGNGRYAGLKKRDDGQFDLVTGKLGGQQFTVPGVVISGVSRWVDNGSGGEELKNPPPGGMSEDALHINNQGQIVFAQTWPNKYRVSLYTPNEGVSVIMSSDKVGFPPDIRGIGPDGMVFGTFFPDEIQAGESPEPRGYVFYKGKRRLLSDYLPRNIVCSMVRRVNEKGLAVGEFKRGGKAIILVVDVKRLIGAGD